MPEQLPPFEPDHHGTDAEDFHEPDDCELCVEQSGTKTCDCRCGDCCRNLLIEVSLRDAAREPKIAVRGSPIYDDMFGPRELIGYLLNGNGGCVFLDQTTNLCTIHETRPLCCREFDCDAFRHNQKPLAVTVFVTPAGVHETISKIFALLSI